MTIVSSQTKPDSEPITFVSCVERGNLENQAVTMLRSLRRFGGGLANARMLCVVGRAGAPLQRSTVGEIAQLKGELVFADRGENPAPWFNYSNKVVAVGIAQRMARTERVAWLDSDVLIASEPSQLLIPPDIDFAARSEEQMPIVYPDDPGNVSYWEAVCSLFDIDFAAVPWVDRGEGGRLQKMYFNSGVFVWRKGSPFAQGYVRAFRRLLDSRIAQRNGDFFTADQTSLTPVVICEKLRWSHLDRRSHHMVFKEFIDGPEAAPSVENAAIIHYSRSLDPAFRQRFFNRLESERPELADWLRANEYRSSVRSPFDLLRLALRAARKLHWLRYARRTKVFVDQGKSFSSDSAAIVR